MVFRKCPVCQKDFRVRRPSDRTKYCSRECQHQSMRRVVSKTCPICGLVFQARPSDKTFCSKSCSSKSRPPKFPGADYRNARRLSSERMKKNNPMSNPAIRALAAARLRGRAIAHRGGNGQLTEPQKKLLAALGSCWKAEYPVTTGLKSWRCVRPYLAYPEIKIAVEVDGSTHNLQRQKVIDRKKTAILESLGWIVLRFTNQEVMTSLEAVLEKINSYTTLK